MVALNEQEAWKSVIKGVQSIFSMFLQGCMTDASSTGSIARIMWRAASTMEVATQRTLPKQREFTSDILDHSRLRNYSDLHTSFRILGSFCFYCNVALLIKNFQQAS